MAKRLYPEETPIADETKPLGMVPLLGCRCRCGHEWLSRDEEKPRVCPKCKSPNWDRPKLWTVNKDKPKGKASAKAKGK